MIGIIVWVMSGVLIGVAGAFVFVRQVQRHSEELDELSVALSELRRTVGAAVARAITHATEELRKRLKIT